MSIAVWVLSALAALAGVRLAAVGLVVAAGLALAAGSPVQVAGAAAAATASVLLFAGHRPRGLAVPLAAAASALLAGTSSNAGVFLVPWISGTLLLAASAPRSRSGRTWAVGLLLCDLPVAAAGVWVAIEGPLATWTSPLTVGPATLLAFAAVLRGLLPSGEPGAAVVGVRAQALVGLALASTGELGPALAVGGGLLFGVAGVWCAGLRRDLLQELGLLALVVAVPGGGSGPMVALLGATSLIILVRLVGPSPSSVASSMATMARSCALGSPLWPVAATVLTGVVRDPNPAAGVVAAALIAGLWGRSVDRDPLPSGARAGPLLVGTALAAGWTAPLLWGPRVWTEGAWPGPVVLAVVAMGAALGALGGQYPDRLRIPRSEIRQPSGPTPKDGHWSRVERLASVRGALAVPSATLVLVAAGCFILGWSRGFL